MILQALLEKSFLYPEGHPSGLKSPKSFQHVLGCPLKGGGSLKAACTSSHDLNVKSNPKP